MAITGSNSTFVRFQIPEIQTADLWGFIDEKLKEAAFKDCQDGQQVANGFADFDDPYDSRFITGTHRKSEYVAFNFRQDQKKIPSSVIKKHVKEQIDKYRENHGGKWPARAEKNEIKENIINWLMSKTEPTPSHYQIIWNVPQNSMFIGATSGKILDAFLEIFEMYFKIYPQYIFNASWASQLGLTNNQQDVLNALVNPKSPSAMFDGKFLGFEFLTWLWYMMDLNLLQQTDFNVMLGEKITLSIPGNEKEKVVCTTQANSLNEAYTALKQGKMVSSLQLFIDKHASTGDNEYLVTIDANLATIRGLKTPKQLTQGDDDLDGIFLEKMFLIEESLTCLDKCYKLFLTKRLSPEWESDVLPALKEWINGDH